MSTEPSNMPAKGGRTIPLLILLGAVIVLGLWFVATGNRLVVLPATAHHGKYSHCKQ